MTDAMTSPSEVSTSAGCIPARSSANVTSQIAFRYSLSASASLRSHSSHMAFSTRQTSRVPVALPLVLGQVLRTNSKNQPI